MYIYIVFTSVGDDAGPFNLYSDVDGYISAFSSNVSKATLEAGYSVEVVDGTTIVRIVSTGVCNGTYYDFFVGGGPVPTTTTTSSTTANPFENYWYYGKYNSPGGVVPIPTELDIDVLTGTLVTLADPSLPISIPFNSANDDFLWFAIPTTVNGKTNWFVNALNQGFIGGPANQFGNLFPEPIEIVYLGIPLYLYISTGRTDVVQMTISGSIVVTTTTTTTMPPALILRFNNITTANSLVGNASDVNDWNTFFNLPTYGNLFTSVSVSGSFVRLNGGSNVILQSSLFEDFAGLLEIDDQNGSIIEAQFNVFENCIDLTTVNLSALALAESDLFKNCGNLISANLPALVNAGNDMFEDCVSLTTVNLPQLETVSFSTFNNCLSLVSIDLPSLISTDSDLFSDCVNLTSVNLPQLVTSDCCIFIFCTSLTSISLPSINVVGDSAFEGCTALTNISLPSCTQLGPTNLDDFVFANIIGNSITLTVPSALMTNNGGNPDGDIQYLQANNTVTIITI